MTRHSLPAAALALAVLIPHHSTTAAKPSSNFVDLGHLGGGFSSAFGINNDASSVQVVGQSTRADGCTHAFFWTSPGPMIDLGTFGGGNSHARDINDHGMIAGGSEDADRRRWAAVWRRAGATWTIENLGTVTGACCASAYGINNGTAGDPGSVAVVGSSAVSGHSEAAVWTMSASGWAVQTLGMLSGDTFSSAHDVNDGGTIVGLSARGGGEIASGFLWTAATGMSRLPGLGGALTYALAINNSGDVAGLSTDTGGRRHAVRWRANTGWTVEDLGTLGGCCSESYGINTFGDVAGVSNVGKRSGLSGTQHGFVARMGSLMIDLAAQGQSAARDLNDFGVVVGEGGGGALPHAVLWRLP
jgi:probable HAF family extracellular repeat protein